MAEMTPDMVLATCVENNGPMLLAIGWALLTLAIIVIFLRVLFRHRYGNGLHGDDYTILASLAMGIAAVIFLTFFVNVGFGQHIYCLSASAIPLMYKYSIIAQIFNIAGIGLVKISVCLHILRIIGRARRDISIFLRLLILITSLSHLAQILLFCVQCRPMAAIWDPQQYPEAKCFSSHITYLAGYIGFGLDAFTDLVTAVIPIVVICALQMKSRTKAALCILMGLGVLTAICAIAKAITLQGVFAADYTWALWRPGLCTIIEHLIGMIIASAPALNPLFKRALRTPTSLYGSSSSHQSGREKQVGKDRQSRRVTRWADAWTPPNVHVAHYSRYADERTKYREQSDVVSNHDHVRHDSKNSNTSDRRISEPSTIATTTNTISSLSNVVALNASLALISGGNGNHRNEITKTVSFRRISEHENEHNDPVPTCSEDSSTNISAHVIDRSRNNYSPTSNIHNENNTFTTFTHNSANEPSMPITTTDRLWIGTRTGYWDLPSAPPLQSRVAPTSLAAPSPPTPPTSALHASMEGVRIAPEPNQESKLELELESEDGNTLTRMTKSLELEPHPAVGRWVGSGRGRPLAREEEMRVVRGGWDVVDGEGHGNDEYDNDINEGTGEGEGS